MNCQLIPTGNRSIHSNSLLKLKTNNLFAKNYPFSNTSEIPNVAGNIKNYNPKNTINPTSISKIDFYSNLKNKKIIVIKNNQDNILLEEENENMKKTKTINHNKNNRSNNKKIGSGNNDSILKSKLENIQKPKNSQNFTKSRNNFIKIQESISLTTLDRINKLRKGRIDKTNSIHNTIHNTNNGFGLNSKEINQINNLISNIPNSNLNVQQPVLNANNPVEKSNFQKYIKIVIYNNLI